MENHTTAADAVNHAVDKIGEALSQVTAALAQTAPHAWELVVRGAVADAVGTIVHGLAQMPFAAALLYACYRIMVWSANRMPKAHDDGTSDICFMVGGVVGVVGGFMVISSIADIANSHSIATLISPDGTVARDMVNRVLYR